MRIEFFKYVVTYVLAIQIFLALRFANIFHSFQSFHDGSVSPCFVTIFSMLLESTVMGLIMCCVYACLIDHFLVSIFVVLLDTSRLRLVHHFFETRMVLSQKEASFISVCSVFVGNMHSMSQMFCKSSASPLSCASFLSRCRCSNAPVCRLAIASRSNLCSRILW